MLGWCFEFPADVSEGEVWVWGLHKVWNVAVGVGLLQAKNILSSSCKKVRERGVQTILLTCTFNILSDDGTWDVRIENKIHIHRG